LARFVLPKSKEIEMGITKPGEETLGTKTINAIKKYFTTLKKHPVESALYTAEGISSGIRNALVDLASTTTRAGKYINPLSVFPSYRKRVDKGIETFRELNERLNKKLKTGAEGKEGYARVRSAGEVIGEIVPYFVSDTIALKALRTAQNLAKTYKLAKLTSALNRYGKKGALVTGFVGTGQVLHQKDDIPRVQQMMADLLMLGIFEVGGSVLSRTLSRPARAIYTKIKNNKKVMADEVEILWREMKANEAGFAKLPHRSLKGMKKRVKQLEETIEDIELGGGIAGEEAIELSQLRQAIRTAEAGGQKKLVMEEGGKAHKDSMGLFKIDESRKLARKILAKDATQEATTVKKLLSSNPQAQKLFGEISDTRVAIFDETHPILKNADAVYVTLDSKAPFAGDIVIRAGLKTKYLEDTLLEEMLHALRDKRGRISDVNFLTTNKITKIDIQNYLNSPTEQAASKAIKSIKKLLGIKERADYYGKSQLTDFYNQAVKGVKEAVPKKLPPKIKKAKQELEPLAREVDEILRTTERSREWRGRSHDLYVQKRLEGLNKEDALDFVDATEIIGDSYRERMNKGFVQTMIKKFPELKTPEARMPIQDFYTQATKGLKEAGEAVPKVKKIPELYPTVKKVVKKIKPITKEKAKIPLVTKAGGEMPPIKPDGKPLKTVGDIMPPEIPSTGKKIDSVVPPYKRLINTDHYDLTQTEKRFLEDMARGANLEKEKGKMTFKQIRAMAKEVEPLSKATTAKETLKRSAMLARARQEMARVTKLEVEMNKGVVGASREYIKGVKNVIDYGTGLARELRSLGMKIEAVPITELKTARALSMREEIIKTLLKAEYDINAIIKAAEGVDFTNPKQVTKFYRKFVKPTFREKLREYRYANLLSSPRTHIVNAFTNAIQTTILAPTTRLVSGGIDFIGSGLTGKARKVYMSEVPAYYKGMFNSINQAVSDALKAIKGEVFIYRPDVPRIPTGGKILSKFQFISRFLEAGDVFFRTLIRGGEKEARLLNMYKDGKVITETAIRDAEKWADDLAEYFVFRKPPDPKNLTKQGYVLSAIDQMTSSMYQLRKFPFMSWFIPFLQTPMNILRQGLEYSPLGITTLAGAGRKTEQLAKTFIGSTIMAGGAYIAFSGNSTWAAPRGASEKEVFYASGKKPYSVKIGDKWVNYSRLGPISYPLAMAAAIQWYVKENPKAATDTALEKMINVIAGIGQFFTDQSYVSGLGDLLDAIRGDVYAIKNATTNLPSQLIPLSSLQKWVAQLIDPIYRKPEKETNIKSLIQNLQKGIPLASKGLEAYTTPEPEAKPSHRQRWNLFLPGDVSPVVPKYEKMLKSYRDIQRMGDISKEKKEEEKETVESRYEELKAMPRQEKINEFNRLREEDPELAKKIANLVQEEKLGLTPEDKAILNLGVTNGDRARFVYKKLMEQKTREEKIKLWNELVTKKIITKIVSRQIIKLLTKEKE